MENVVSGSILDQDAHRERSKKVKDQNREKVIRGNNTEI